MKIANERPKFNSLRRNLLIGAAASAAATAMPAGAEESQADPATAASSRYLAALNAEYSYRTKGGVDWSDDPEACRRTDEVCAAFEQMCGVKPTTMRGLSMMIRAALFQRHGYCIGADDRDPETWAWSEDASGEVSLAKNMIAASLEDHG